MKRNFKHVFSLLLVLSLVVSLFAGCSKDEETSGVATSNNTSTSSSTSSDSSTSSTDTASLESGTYDEFITVDVFCSQANYQGIQSGWFGQVVKDKFNMELNIIAPNVAGGGDTLFQTRSAAGNLGDIVMIGAENGRLADTVLAGLLMDLTPYMDKAPNIARYDGAVTMLQNLIDDHDGIYAIPSSVSSYPATEPSESTEPTFGPYVRWDYYTEIGSPSMSTLEDLLPVLKQMQEAHPESDSGQPTYAFSLFKDWDGNMMMFGKQPACFYGYDELGFVFATGDGSDFQDITQSDSAYVRDLKLYFDANQMGLVDPESTTQNWDTVWNKYTDGAVLFSPWPWLGQAAYNTTDNLKAGKGFMMAPIDDMKIFSYGATPTGSKYVVGVGSQAQDPDRMVAFLDWLYSPEGIMMSTSQTGSTCGPEGLTWEMVDGAPSLTDFGVSAMLGDGADMPAQWGGGTWADGVSQLNFTTVLPKDINPDNGFAYDFKLWDSYLLLTATPVHESWQAETGYLSTFELLRDKDMLVVGPGTDYIAPAEPAEISTLRSQCKSIIIENSWKMVFAKDEDEFYELLKDMQDTIAELGYQDVLDYDMNIAKEQEAARAANR